MPIFIFYKIVCKDENIKDCYVGKTTDLKKRWNCHKSRYKNDKKYNFKLYQFIRENGGWNNFNIIEIEKGEYDDKDSAIRERYWIEELNANLNSDIPSRTRREYHKEYYKENYKKYKKENNKEYNKKYYEDNIEKKKQYYKDNIEKLKEKITCECGCEITKASLTRHKQSKKHIEKMI